MDRRGSELEFLWIFFKCFFTLPFRLEAYWQRGQDQSRVPKWISACWRLSWSFNDHGNIHYLKFFWLNFLCLELWSRFPFYRRCSGISWNISGQPKEEDICFRSIFLGDLGAVRHRYRFLVDGLSDFPWRTRLGATTRFGGRGTPNYFLPFLLAGFRAWDILSSRRFRRGFSFWSRARRIFFLLFFFLRRVDILFFGIRMRGMGDVDGLPCNLPNLFPFLHLDFLPLLIHQELNDVEYFRLSRRHFSISLLEKKNLGK